ncbi:M protein trans-acting positive regulator, partial [Listeria monocytogenes]|nr:M protein trans-acting positive regulator [Listeria monocytogenes]
IPLQYLTKEALNETHIDMVVTNYPRYLSDYHIETEYFLLKPLPDEQDWDYLERKLSSAQSPLF